MSKHRFVAHWIEDMDDDGTDKQSSSVHDTFDAAHAAALAGSKRAGAIEWLAVREQIWMPDREDSRIGCWDTVNRWTGDYEQVEQSQP